MSSPPEIEIIEREPLYTINTLAEYLQCSPRKVRGLIASGHIEVVYIGPQSPRIRPESVDSYLAACEGEDAAA